jgi:hypothetical protein
LIARRSEDGAVCKVVDAMGDHGFRSEISRFLQPDRADSADSTVSDT